jgi:hemoglobin
MVVHRALPDLTHSLFERWLDLFHESASVLPNRAMAERAVELSQRIAQSLWYGYQLQREADGMPASLPPRAETHAPLLIRPRS